MPETAARLRGRIEVVLDAAKAKGYRAGENPAAWRGNLDHLLPKRQRLMRRHYRALPYAQVPALVARLQESGSVAALCLEFTILTAARSSEALKARNDEFDLDRALWTIPPERMKGGREHVVPLSARPLGIIETLMLADDGSEHVFLGPRRRRALVDSHGEGRAPHEGRCDRAWLQVGV